MSDINTLDTLLTRFVAIPGRVAQTIEGQSEEELRAKPSQDVWSMVDIFAHMRASDAIVTPRIYAILVRDTPQLIAYDERRWAKIARYEHLAFRPSLHLFTVCRVELINMLRSLASDYWQRVGIHEELGTQTVWGIVTGLLKHEEEHCAQLAALIQR